MIDPSFLAGTKALPPEIVGAIRHVIRRARFAILLRGASAAWIAALISFFAIMAIDAGITLVSPGSRWLLSGAAYAVTAAAILWYIVRPLARTLTLAGMARIIETRHPEMQERLSSIIEILTGDDAPAARGSAELIEELKKEAVRAALVVRP